MRSLPWVLRSSTDGNNNAAPTMKRQPVTGRTRAAPPAHRVLPWNLRSRSRLPWVLRSLSDNCTFMGHDEVKKQLIKVASSAAVKRTVKKTVKPEAETIKPPATTEIKQSKKRVQVKKPVKKTSPAPVKHASKGNKPSKIARRGTKRFEAELKAHLDRTTRGGSDDLLATPIREGIVKLPVIPHIDSPIMPDMEDIVEVNGVTTPDQTEYTCPTPVSIKATPVYKSLLSPLVIVRRLPPRLNKMKWKHPTLEITKKKAAQDRKWEKSLQQMISQQLAALKKSEEAEAHIPDEDEEEFSNDE